MKSHLKIKVVSLSGEMSYQRRQEAKWKEKARVARQKQKDNAEIYCMDNFWSIRGHRNELKVEARNTHLAYGAIRGVPYSAMEHYTYGGAKDWINPAGEKPFKGYNRDEPNWVAIEAMVDRFTKDEPNRPEIMQRFSEWLSDAKKWLESSADRINYERANRKHLRDVLRSNPAYQAERQRRNEAARAGNYSGA